MTEPTGTCPKCLERHPVYRIDGKGKWFMSYHKSIVPGGFSRPGERVKCPGVDREAKAVSGT